MSFDVVPIAEINCDNVNKVWPYLMNSIHKAEIIALDLELSGIGERTGSRKNFSDRYLELRRTAQSRTVFSIGIATFQKVKNIADAQNKEVKYRCKVFDLLSLALTPFVVEPDALTFLSSHGFNFNRLLSHGIKYSKSANSGMNLFKLLWEEILASGVSIMLHNGLNDLVFIHEHFYSELPESLEEFIANISDWFGIQSDPSNNNQTNIWDNKYLTSLNKNFKSSYLEYAFRKAQRENYLRMETGTEPYVEIRFSRFRKIIRNEIPFSQINISLTNDFLHGKTVFITQEQICTSYKNYGHCDNRWSCEKEHEIDLILDLENKIVQFKRDKEKRRREKKLYNKNLESNWQQAHSEPDSNKEINKKRKKGGLDYTDKKKTKTQIEQNLNHENLIPEENGTFHGPGFIQTEIQRTFNGHSIPHGTFASRGQHRAGMDAFMTGFSTLFLNLDYAYLHSGRLDEKEAGRIPLPGKDFPLLLRKGIYSHQSERHILNWQRIESRRQAFKAAKREDLEYP